MKKENYLKSLDDQIDATEQEINDSNDSITETELNLRISELARKRIERPEYALKFHTDENTQNVLDSQIKDFKHGIETDRMILKGKKEELKCLKLKRDTANDYEDYDES